MNLHTPERQPNESQAQYRERQAKSRAVNRALTVGPTQAPAISPLDVSRFFLGQHTNPGKAPSKRDLHRLASKTFTHKAKPQKARKHKQHKHPLRDEHGTFTKTGARAKDATGLQWRRIWLAGISAQRGY